MSKDDEEPRYCRRCGAEEPTFDERETYCAPDVLHDYPPKDQEKA